MNETSWNAIKSEYENGASARALGRKWEISHVAIGKRAQKDGWTRLVTSERLPTQVTSAPSDTGNHPTGNHGNHESDRATPLDAIDAIDQRHIDAIEENDGPDDFDWNNKALGVVCQQMSRIAVYENLHGQLVIRQQNDLDWSDGTDACVYIDKRDVAALIHYLQWFAKQ